MAQVVLGTTGLVPAPAPNPVLVPAAEGAVTEGAGAVEPVGLQRHDTLREQLFRKDRQIRNLLFVGDGDGSILLRPARNGPGSATANGQSTTSTARVTANSRLASVLLPYSGPRPSMANHLCLRSWTLIWAPALTPSLIGGSESTGQELEEEDETPSIISTLRKGKVWFDTYSSCFDWLKNELLAIWDLEDVSRSSVSAEFRFGSALLGASTASRFHDMDQQLGSAVRSIEAGNTHLYFLPDNHECLLAAATGVDADAHHSEVIHLTMTVFNKEKLSYVTAHAELVLPSAETTPDTPAPSDEQEPETGRRFRITKVETSGIRLIWTLMAFPEKEEEPEEGEDEKAQHSAERDRSGPQPSEGKNEPDTTVDGDGDDGDGEEEEEESEESGSDEDDEERSETETQTETQMNDPSDEEASDLGLTAGKRRARYRHVRPIELIFHCNAEKSLAHPTVPFIQSVLKAIATNIDTLCQVAKGELSEEASVAEPSPWASDAAVNSDRPRFATALLQICKAFHDSNPSTADGKRTIYSNPNVPTLETEEYAVTRFKVDCIKRKTIRGIDVNVCQCLSVDFAPYRFRQAASYTTQTQASGQGLSRYEELELAARRAEAEANEKELASTSTPTMPPPPVGEGEPQPEPQPQRENSEEQLATPKLPPGIHSHLFQNESVYSIDFDRNVYCTNEVRIDWELLGYRSNEANLEAMEKVGSLCRYLVSEATEERSAKVRETVWKKHQAREEQRKADAELEAKEQKYQSPRRKVHDKTRREESRASGRNSRPVRKTKRVVPRSSRYEEEEEPQYDFHAGYRATAGVGKESTSRPHRHGRGTGRHRKTQD